MIIALCVHLIGSIASLSLLGFFNKDDSWMAPGAIIFSLVGGWLTFIIWILCCLIYGLSDYLTRSPWENVNPKPKKK